MTTLTVWTTAPNRLDRAKPLTRTRKIFTVVCHDHFGGRPDYKVQWREMTLEGTDFAIADQCDRWRISGQVTLDDPRVIEYGLGKTPVPTNNKTQKW